MQFQDKIVLITGANRGIGKALVKACLAKEVKKVYATSRNIGNLPSFDDPRVVSIQLDVADKDQIKAAAQKCQDTQILINNAGTLNPGSVFLGEVDGFRKDMEVNFFSVIEMMRAFAPVLSDNEEPRIVNIASIASYVNFPFIAGYSASKAALYSISQAARIELSAKNIPVHIVNPGAIDTDMNKGSTMQMTPPDEVAKNIIEMVEREIEDIVPDRIGKDMFATWQKSPRDLEELAGKIYFGE
ncbi:SDR family oxidoreductase [Bdellovibrio sp. NC01]|uniref:SDR family oxidoreductase n=1 Tax=Bdellovibrio sp. NC01 TaxID=2220073 RepID=UPI001158119D|nr:SDR family oxidoreductase [Bdellovibrio sp. NC01]QDK37546.1 short-chain dehydrogenase [Bdellovibrio sp. NC01]